MFRLNTWKAQSKELRSRWQTCNPWTAMPMFCGNLIFVLKTAIFIWAPIYNFCKEYNAQNNLNNYFLLKWKTCLTIVAIFSTGIFHDFWIVNAQNIYWNLTKCEIVKIGALKGIQLAVCLWYEMHWLRNAAITILGIQQHDKNICWWILP